MTVAEPYRAATMDTVLIPVDEGEYEEQSRRLSERAMEQVKMAAEAAGVPCETIREVHDQPYRAIIDAAHALGCDLIVMASHGRRGISALLLGSETVKGADALDHSGAGLSLRLGEPRLFDARRPARRYLASGAVARRLSFARSARACLTRTNCWSASTPIRMTVPMTAKLSELGMPSRLTRFCRT